jgi:hypothetical protein
MKWIYRVDDAAGRCLYVGQTKRLRARRSAHLTRWPGAAFVPLRQCNDADALRLEKQVTLAYKRRGQAQFNIQNDWPSGPLIPGVASLLFALESGIEDAYATVGEFGVCLQKTSFGLWVLWIGGLDSNCSMHTGTMRRLLAEWAQGKRQIIPFRERPGAGLLVKT